MSQASAVPFGIFTVDPSLAVRTWPDWLADVTGIAAVDALSHSLAELVPDLGERGLLPVLERVLSRGTVEVLAPALHQYLIPCPPSTPHTSFTYMQQRVTVGPIRQDDRIVGAVITIEDVTERVQQERELSERLPALTRTLGDADFRTRRAAVDALAPHGQAIVDALVATIRQQHADFNVLSSALDLLATSNIDVIDPLAECLKDEDANLRIQAALILGTRRDRRATPALLAALDDPDVNVVFHAIEALGHIGATEAVEPLLRIVERRDFFLGFPAIHTLSRIGDATVAPRLVPLLADDLLRTPTVEALGEMADEAVVGPLVDLLNAGAAPTEVLADALTGLHDRYDARYGAGEHVADLVRRSITAAGTQHVLDAVHRVSGERLRGLARILGWLEGPAVQRALTRLLGDAAVRAQVVEALVRYGSGVVDLLVEQLRAEDLDSRHAAAVALGRIGDRGAVPALIAALEDRELALPAAGALARIGAPEAFEPLLRHIGDQDTAIRQAVIAALNSIGDARMAGRIRDLLGDPRPLVRESAVKIAGYFGYPECVDQVLAMSADSSEIVRRAVVDHLPYFDDSRAASAAIAMLEHDTPKVRAAAASALGRLERAFALPALVKAVCDPDPWVRYFCVRALGTFRDTPTAVAAVVERLQKDDAGQVRLAAIEVLGQLDPPEAVTLLGPLTSASDQDVAGAAIRALGHSHSAEAASILESAARAREAWRRTEAVAAIASRGGRRAPGILQWVAAADDDDAVSATALDGLRRCVTAGGPVASDAIRALLQLLAEPSRREPAVAALSSLPPRHAEDVAAGLEHGSMPVRRGVVEALGRMRHPEASRVLESALDDREASVRAAAITELRRLGSRNAVRKLLGMARTDPDADVRHAAILAVTSSAS